MPDTKQVSMDVNWQLANDAAIAWARRHSGTLVTNIVDTTRDKIRRSVAGGIQAGDNLGQLRTRVMGTGAFSPARAQLIARTEVTASYAEGNLTAWKESGVTEGKMWNTRNDEIVCAICGPLDGTIAPLDGVFEDGSDAPPAHPGCRCWVTPKVIGDIETGEEIFEAYGLEREPGIGAPSGPATGVASSIEHVILGNVKPSVVQAMDEAYDGAVGVYQSNGIKIDERYVRELRIHTTDDLPEWATMQGYYNKNSGTIGVIPSRLRSFSGYTAATSADDVYVHEIGHAIQDTIGNKTIMRNIAPGLDVPITLNEEWADAFVSQMSRDPKRILSTISEYATTDEFEAFAESMLLRVRNGSSGITEFDAVLDLFLGA